MKRSLLSLVAVAAAAGLVIAGCGQAAPAPTPTKAPAAPTKAPEPTKPAAATAAPAKAAEPTKAPAAPPQPTAAPAKKVDWPEKGKTISWLIATSAGGATDIAARLLAPVMEKELGVPIQVVNRPGAGSQLGYTEMAKAKPDGYTIGFTNVPSVLTVYLDPARGAQYGRKDLVQVGNHVQDPEVFVVTNDSPFKTVKDVVDAAKAKPEQVKMSITGTGNDNHLALLLFEKMTGVKFAIVNFQGGAPALTALLGGHVDINIATLGNFADQYKSKQIRIIGLMDKDRNKLIPEVPTFKEQGYDISYASTRGISVPAGTPREIVDILGRALKKAMDDPGVQKRMDDMFLTQRYMDAAQFTAYWDEVEAQTRPLMDLLLVK